MSAEQTCWPEFVYGVRRPDGRERVWLQRTRAIAEDRGYRSARQYLEAGGIGWEGTTVKTVKSSGGDYADMSSWESSRSSPLTDDQECSIEDDFNAGDVEINYSDGGYTTLITVASANRFHQDSNWPTDMDTAMGQKAHIDASANNCIRLKSTQNVTIEWIELYYSGTFGYCVTAQTEVLPTGTVIRNCWLHGNGTSTNSRGIHTNESASPTGAGTATSDVHNCLFYYLRYGILAFDPVMTIEHCTFALQVGSGRGIYALDYQASSAFTITVNDSISIGYGVDFYASGADLTLTGDNLASGDTSASTYATSTYWNSVAASTMFEDPGVTNVDLRMDSAQAGNYLGGNSTEAVDVGGTARPGGGYDDIGCFQITTVSVNELLGQGLGATQEAASLLTGRHAATAAGRGVGSVASALLTGKLPAAAVGRAGTVSAQAVLTGRHAATARGQAASPGAGALTGRHAATAQGTGSATGDVSATGRHTATAQGLGQTLPVQAVVTTNNPGAIYGRATSGSTTQASALLTGRATATASGAARTYVASAPLTGRFGATARGTSQTLTTSSLATGTAVATARGVGSSHITASLSGTGVLTARGVGRTAVASAGLGVPGAVTGRGRGGTYASGALLVVRSPGLPPETLGFDSMNELGGI